MKQARLAIAHFSLDRAANRLAGAKRKRESPDEDEEAEQTATIALMSSVSVEHDLLSSTRLECDPVFTHLGYGMTLDSSVNSEHDPSSSLKVVL